MPLLGGVVQLALDSGRERHLSMASESQKQLKQLDEQAAADEAAAKSFAGPKVTNYGTVAGGDIVGTRAKVKESEARLTPAEETSYWNQRNKLRTGKK